MSARRTGGFWYNDLLHFPGQSGNIREMFCNLDKGCEMKYKNKKTNRQPPPGPVISRLKQSQDEHLKEMRREWREERCDRYTSSEHHKPDVTLVEDAAIPRGEGRLNMILLYSYGEPIREVVFYSDDELASIPEIRGAALSSWFNGFEFFGKKLIMHRFIRGDAANLLVGIVSYPELIDVNYLNRITLPSEPTQASLHW